MVRGITYILNTDTGFQSEAGLNVAGSKYKAYPVVCTAPEQSPYSVVTQTRMNPTFCKSGMPTLAQYSFQVVSFHKNYEDCVDLDNAVKEALSEKTGTFNTITFKQIRLVDSFDGPFDPQFSVYSRISVFTANVNEDQAT